MQVTIVTFPETRVASITHRGPPERESETARILVDWKLRHRLFDQSRYRSYGLHYTDSRTASAAEHRVDFCLSIEGPVEDNAAGIVERTLPALRCALARDVGSREDNQAARYLVEEWLPGSGEVMADYPLIFHYVNVGPGVGAHEAITDVYLPLERA